MIKAFLLCYNYGLLDTSLRKCLLFQILLLCGPPGLGKTTLSHVVAKHAGYNVVEMNARYEITIILSSQEFDSVWQFDVKF